MRLLARFSICGGDEMTTCGGEMTIYGDDGDDVCRFSPSSTVGFRFSILLV